VSGSAPAPAGTVERDGWGSTQTHDVMATVRSVRRDVGTLGVSAPLRAAYEASKRFGGHRLVFGGLASRGTPRPELRLALRVVHEVPESAAERCVKTAEEIIGGDVVLFSGGRAVGSPPDAHLLIDGPGRWPGCPWWTIDIRSESRLADVKWTWELGRARHLAVLARAATVADGGLAKEANRHLQAWATQNPAESGIHWYSNLEIALRSLVYSEVAARLGSRLSSETSALLTGQLWHAGRHLVADLPYTVSTMRNNHLLGDALGLQIIGTGLAERATARCWLALGERLFAQQAGRHFHPDGSMVEDSLSYHRFVLEMLVVHALIEGHAEPHPALVPSAQMLARLGALEGPIPQYGDWDEGRVLVSTQDASSVAGSVRAALSIAGSGALPEWREAHDECAWYARTGDPVHPEPAERDGRDIGGGIARVQRGPFTVWLKAGSGPSHGHADLCSSPVLVDKHWVVGDPGTGTYNGPIEQRNYFRSSRAHSVLRIGGLDQLEPYRAFRWTYKAAGRVGAPLKFGETVVMWGGHDAYSRLSPRRRVVRTVVVAPVYIAVADWVEGPAGERYELSIPLGPRARWNPVQETVELPSGKALSLRLPGEAVPFTGQELPFDGWWSRTYGHVEPCTRLNVTGRIEGPVSWGLGSGPQPAPLRVSANELVVDDFSLRITWGEESTWLSVEHAGRSTESFLGWPR
jgi:hypothetical protein